METGEEFAGGGFGAVEGCPVELAGEPGREPDGEAGGCGVGGGEGFDGEGVDAVEVFLVGGVEELGDELAPACEAEPGGVAAVGADGGVEAELEGGGGSARVGEVEDQAGAFVAEVAEEGFVGSGVFGPPEDEGEVGLEEGADGARDEVDGFGACAEDDAFGADLGEAGGREVAEGGDLGADGAAGLVGAAEHDGAAGVAFGDGVEVLLEAVGVGGSAHDDEVGEGDAGDVGMLQVGAADLFGGGTPEAGELGLDVLELDGHTLTAQEVVGGGGGHEGVLRWRMETKRIIRR